MEEQRLIYNAHQMIKCCRETNSNWGVAYWTSVLNYLTRKFERLN